MFKKIINIFSIKKSQPLPPAISKEKLDEAQDESIDQILKEVSLQKQVESDFYFQQRESAYQQFNPDKIDPKYSTDAPLSAVEKSFLKYMSNRSVDSPSIPGYWTYEYCLDPVQTLYKLIASGYLEISNNVQSLKFSTARQLKELLRKYDLPVSGKKADLIQRIQKNLTDEQIETSQLIRNCFVLTGKGICEIKDCQDSATKDIDMENRCISKLQTKDLNGAYRIICEWEAKKQFPRGLGIDWKSLAQREQPLSTIDLEHYSNILNYNGSLSFKLNDVCYDNEIKCSLILSKMLGKSHRSAIKIFSRIAGFNPKNHSVVDECVRFLSNLEFDVAVKENNNSLDKLGCKYYQVLSSSDDKVCSICKQKHNKIFQSSEYQVGITAPPFHPECRCIIVPYFSDK